MAEATTEEVLGVPVDCYDCGGVGWVSRYEENPLWYDEDDLWLCRTCNGAGGWVEVLDD